MGDKKGHRYQSDAEQLKRWLLGAVESLQARTQATTLHITDLDRDRFTAALSACDVQQLRYLCSMVEDIIDSLRVLHGHISEALDRRFR